MSLTTPAGGAALEVLGQGLSALLYALLFLHLLRAGPARWGSARNARWFLAAVGITAMWSAASALDPPSRHALPAYLAAALDALRYAAWIGLLWMLMRPAGSLSLPSCSRGPLPSVPFLNRKNHTSYAGSSMIFRTLLNQGMASTVLR